MAKPTDFEDLLDDLRRREVKVRKKTGFDRRRETARIDELIADRIVDCVIVAKKSFDLANLFKSNSGDRKALDSALVKSDGAPVVVKGKNRSAIAFVVGEIDGQVFLRYKDRYCVLLEDLLRAVR